MNRQFDVTEDGMFMRGYPISIHRKGWNELEVWVQGKRAQYLQLKTCIRVANEAADEIDAFRPRVFNIPGWDLY